MFPALMALLPSLMSTAGAAGAGAVGAGATALPAAGMGIGSAAAAPGMAAAMPAAGMGQGAAAMANPAMSGGGSGLFDSVFGGSGLATGEQMAMPTQAGTEAPMQSGERPGGMWDMLMEERQRQFKNKESRNPMGLSGLDSGSGLDAGKAQDPMSMMGQGMSMGMVQQPQQERKQLTPMMHKYIQSLMEV